MRLSFLFASAVLIAAALSGTAVAQEDVIEISTDDTDDSIECESPEHIDRTLELCDHSMSDGTATITLVSDRNQTVEVADMGGYMTPGEPAVREVDLEDGRATIVVDVTVVDDRAGVAIRTDRDYYPVLVDEPTVLIGGPWSASDVQVGVLGSLFAGGIVMVVGTILAKRGELDSPERVR